MSEPVSPENAERLRDEWLTRSQLPASETAPVLEPKSSSPAPASEPSSVSIPREKLRELGLDYVGNELVAVGTIADRVPEVAAAEEGSEGVEPPKIPDGAKTAVKIGKPVSSHSRISHLPTLTQLPEGVFEKYRHQRQNGNTIEAMLVEQPFNINLGEEREPSYPEEYEVEEKDPENPRKRIKVKKTRILKGRLLHAGGQIASAKDASGRPLPTYIVRYSGVHYAAWEAERFQKHWIKE